MMGIKDAAAILFDTLLPMTDNQRAEARIILRYFGVKTEDAPKVKGVFGKAAKLYDEADVRKVAEFNQVFK